MFAIPFAFAMRPGRFLSILLIYYSVVRDHFGLLSFFQRVSDGCVTGRLNRDDDLATGDFPKWIKAAELQAQVTPELLVSI